MFLPRFLHRTLGVVSLLLIFALGVTVSYAAPSVTIVEVDGTTLVTEGGATDSYTIVLGEIPSGDVTITLTPNAQVSLSAATLTFTTLNWFTAQTVTVTAVNDFVAEGAHSGTITHSATGGGYTGVTIVGVTAAITDNDVKGVTIAESGGTTLVTEGGATDTYTAVLTSQPTADVIITIITADGQTTALSTVGSLPTLTFTTVTWNVAQTVTVTAVNDAMVEGAHSGTITHSATGSGYTGVTIAGVTAAITDNDIPGVTIVELDGTTLVTEGSTIDTYTVVLTNQPATDVTITLTPDAQVSLSAATLTFTNGDWNVAQTVTVTAVNDSIAEGAHSGTITHSATGSGYNGVTIAGVTAAITDNDVKGVTISKTAVAMTEGGATDTYTAVLTSQPTANVILSIGVSSQTTTNPTSLTFTATDWNFPQIVTVTAVDDPVDEPTPHSGGPINHTPTGGGYTGVTVASISTSITDNDTAGVTIVQSGGSTDVTEAGATDDYTVVLDTQPLASVTLTLTTDGEVTVSPTSLIFTTVNWNAPRTVTVTAVNDNVSEGNHIGVISQGASGGGYTGVTIGDVTANIIDNDIKGVTIVESSSSTDVTEGSTIDTFTVVLNTKPTGSVTIPLTGTQVSLSPVSLTFSAANWFTPQTVTVTAINDSIDEASPHAGSVGFNPSGGGYGPVVVPDLAVNITDNDTAGVTIVQSGGTTNVTEGGATDSYTVVLDTQPTANVTIVLTGTQVTPSPAPLTFTSSNWLTAQTVTVTAVNDAIVEGAHSGSVSHVATGGGYTGLIIAGVTASITDNDLGSLIISPLTADVTESGVTDSYSVVLGAQPSNNVTVTMTPDAEVTTTPTALTFTVGNWDTPQPVTVTAVNDAIVEGTHTGTITHNASGGGYAGVSGADVTANITDNDIGGAILVQSDGTTAVAEAGLTSDTYTLVLTAQPKGTVTVTLTAGANTSVNPTTLTFNPGNWNTPRTVTVTAVNNFIDEGDFYFNTLTHSAVGGGYTGAVLPNLVVTIANNDEAGLVGINLLPLGHIVTEGGNTDALDLRLESEPTGDVTISLATTADFTVSPASLTFTSVNWRDYQEITMTAVDDALLEGTEIIALTFPSSGAPGYTGTFIGVNLTVVDNDATLTPDIGSGLAVAEGGVSDSYTVALNDNPISMVTVTVRSTQCEISANNIAFAANALITLNGTTPVTVFMRAVDDSLAEGAHTCTLSHDPTVSTDPSYNGMVISALIATVTDNDSAGFTVSDTGGNTSLTEGGAGDNFNVVLTSQPTATVTVMLTSDSDSTTAPTSLTFTPANWNFTQTVAANAIDDRIVEGAHSTSITLNFSSSDPQYNLLTGQVTPSVSDNDSASVSFTDASGVNLENVGMVVRTVVITYTTTGAGNFGLDAPLTVQLSAQNLTASIDDYTLDVTSVSFGVDAADNATRNYSYTLINDNVAETDEVFSVVLGSPSSANSAMLANITANDSLSATILNDDTAGITIEESGGSSTVTEGGFGDDYTVVLATEPLGTVTITLTTSQVTVTPSTLTFNPGNWNMPQGVSITAIDDLISEGIHTGSITNTSGGSGYSGSTTFNVTVNDNDSQAVTVFPATVTVTEDGLTGTFTVVLGSQPTGSVSISMSGGTQATPSPDVLNFTTGNWNTPKTVTVSAIDDGLVEAIEHLGFINLTPTGGGYDAVVIENVDVNIIDNDAEGVIVSPFAVTAVEGGAAGTYTLRLRTQPPSDVTLNLTGDPQISLSPATVTFIPAQWNIPQTITVTGVNDGLLEGPQTATILHAVTSNDPNYNGILVANVTVTILDGQSQLLLNGGFEVQGATPDLADSWVGKKLVATKDLRLCNTIENPGVAFEGVCAFQFKAAGSGSPVSRKINQVFVTPLWGFKNDQLTLSAQLNGFKVKTGGKLTLKVVYNDNTVKNVSINIPTGTYAYTFKTRTLTLARRVKKVTVVMNMAKVGGQVRLDAVSLTLTPKALRTTLRTEADVLGLPPAPLTP